MGGQPRKKLKYLAADLPGAICAVQQPRGGPCETDGEGRVLKTVGFTTCRGGGLVWAAARTPPIPGLAAGAIRVMDRATR